MIARKRSSWSSLPSSKEVLTFSDGTITKFQVEKGVG